MPIHYVIPYIDSGGHMFDISINFRPFLGEHYHDPCNTKCYKYANNRLQEITNEIKEGLRLVREKKLGGLV